LGGGGSASASSVRIAERGVRGFLTHAGICDADAGTRAAPRMTTLLDMPDGDCYTTSEHDGLIEMCKDLGDTVEAGEVLARVHDITRTGARPREYRARR